MFTHILASAAMQHVWIFCRLEIILIAQSYVLYAERYQGVGTGFRLYHQRKMSRNKRRALLVLLLVAFIVNLPCKILEQELWGTKFKTLEDEETQRLQRQESHRTTSGDADHIIAQLTLNFSHPLKESPWKIASNWVTIDNTYPAEAPEMGAILNIMATGKITKADVGYKGSQNKMSLTLEGGQKAVFKPKRYSRSHVIEGWPYGGGDRHNGEITSFHLGRLLEFRRTPLVVGRVVDMETEIGPVAETSLKDTFYKLNNNSCFHGKCFYCTVDIYSEACGDGTKLEGALILWLPETMKLKMFKSPWKRLYRNNTLIKNEIDDTYCETDKLLNSRPRLMDIMDTSILDYLVGNADRHTYDTITEGNKSMIILIDNGKSVGNPYEDEKSILGPLYQCCRLRETTWSRLLILQNGVLSTVLKALLAQDPIAPILTDLHLQALDRRLEHIITGIKDCIDKNGNESVFSIEY